MEPISNFNNFIRATSKGYDYKSEIKILEQHIQAFEQLSELLEKTKIFDLFITAYETLSIVDYLMKNDLVERERRSDLKFLFRQLDKGTKLFDFLITTYAEYIAFFPNLSLHPYPSKPYILDIHESQKNIIQYFLNLHQNITYK